MIDINVLHVQQWYNSTYQNTTGFIELKEDGITGHSTCRALIHALQIELGMSNPDGDFGPATITAFENHGIPEKTTNANLIRILQGGFYCKGIDCHGFDGVYGNGVSNAITTFKSQTGIGGSGVIDARHMKALLNTDAFTLVLRGNIHIRDAQQYLNSKYSDLYWKKIGLIACSGVVDNKMAKAIAFAIQAEEVKSYNLSSSAIDGVVGTNTLDHAPRLTINSPLSSYVKIVQISLMCMYNYSTSINGIFDSELSDTISEFQQFMCLNQDSSVVLGTVDRKTWAALLISTGDHSRFHNACDCSIILDADKARSLAADGFKYIGRYLTGKVDGHSKAITYEELLHMFHLGLHAVIFYENNGNYAEYFDYDRGYNDAKSASVAAEALHLPSGTIIYFAVDYDFMDGEVRTIVKSYFEGINAYFSQNGNKYRIGIYGSRNTCTVISESNLAISSYVSDISTGYSGNLGYKLPDNWAFDQFKELKYFSSVGEGEPFDLDHVVASGKDRGVGHTIDHVSPAGVGDNIFNKKPPTAKWSTKESLCSSTFISKLIALEDAFHEYNNTFAPDTEKNVLCSEAILDYLSFYKYKHLNNDPTSSEIPVDVIQWNLISSVSPGYIAHIRTAYPDVDAYFSKYIGSLDSSTYEPLTDGLLNGLLELPHLAIGILCHLRTIMDIPDWATWAGDGVTALKELYANTYAQDNNTADIKLITGAAEKIYGMEENGDAIQFNLCDFYGDADAKELSKRITSAESEGSLHPISSVFSLYYSSDCQNRKTYLINAIGASANTTKDNLASLINEAITNPILMRYKFSEKLDVNLQNKLSRIVSEVIAYYIMDVM